MAPRLWIDARTWFPQVGLNTVTEILQLLGQFKLLPNKNSKQ